MPKSAAKLPKMLKLHCLSKNLKGGYLEYTLGIFWLKHTQKEMIAYFHICSTVFDRDLEFISQFLLPKGNQKIYDFKLFQCDNLAFFKEFVGAFM